MSETSWSNEWIEMARMDLHSAEFLLDMRPLPIEIVCFHCEQAAEKMLKGAWLPVTRNRPGRTTCPRCADCVLKRMRRMIRCWIPVLS